MKGHIGIYIGGGLAAECTPKWRNCVQITAVANIGAKTGYNSRRWTKYGKLPYVTYEAAEATAPAPSAQEPAAVKVDPAQYRDDSLAGKYTVTAKSGLHIRAGAGTGMKSLGVRRFGRLFYTLFKSITVDNGCEFQDFEGIEIAHRRKGKRTIVFFCHPYSAYERAATRI